MEEELDLDFQNRKPLTDPYIQSEYAFWKILIEDLLTEECGCFFMIVFLKVLYFLCAYADLIM